MKIESEKVGSLPENQRYNRLLLIPLILAMAIVPLIIKQAVYDPGLNQYSWYYSDTEKVSDFFLYYKQWFIVGIGVLMLLILSFKLYFDKQNNAFRPIFLPLILYVVMAVISVAISKYKSYSLLGGYEQFENIFVLVTYCIIVYYAYCVIKYESDVRFIINAFLISCIILSVLGLTQIVGHDFFATNLGEHLILNKDHIDQIGKLTFGFGKNRVYLTFYNPNYVGVYAGLVIPILATFIYFSENKKKTVMYILVLFGVLLSLIGAKSKSAIIGLGVSIIFFAILLRKQLIRKWYFTVPVVVAAITLILLIVIPASPLYYFNVSTLFQKQSQVEDKQLQEITTSTDYVTVKYNNEVINIQLLVNDNTFSGLNFWDGNGDPIIDVNIIDSENYISYEFQNEKYAGLAIVPSYVGVNQYLGFYIAINGENWCFTNQVGDGTYHYVNRGGKVDDIVTADSMFFKGKENFATGRGYIWSRTFPLLKDHFFLGSGPDTFTVVFPQQDYVAASKYGFKDQLVTRPHSLYLQIATQTGVISLIGFLAFYIMYFVSSIKLYLKNEFKTYNSHVGVAVFIGSIGYMICGITNDSSVCVAPIFWTLLGVGIAVNFMVKKEKQIA